MKAYNYKIETCDMFEFMSEYLGLSQVHPGGQASAARVFAQLQLNPGQKVLDVGCGKGKSALQLVKKYKCQVTGIDLNESYITEAKIGTQDKGLSSAAQFIKCSAEKMLFSESSFDRVMGLAVLVMLEDLELALNETYRVLKPFGRVTWLELAWREEPTEQMRRHCLRQIGAICLEKIQTVANWQKHFEQAGFTEIKTEIYPLKSRGLPGFFADEGLLKGIQIFFKLLSEPALKQRLQQLAAFFQENQLLCYTIISAQKPAPTI